MIRRLWMWAVLGLAWPLPGYGQGLAVLAPADGAVEDSNWKSFAAPDDGRMGNLGEKLRQAMKDQKSS